jgi:2,4-dienoyl-CoA reductase (NADPH2)
MHTGLEEERGGFPKLAAYFAERARGGVGLIVTGGISPNFRGSLTPWGAQLAWPWQVSKHRLVTAAVHAEGGHIALQILHGGRYSYSPFSVAPSAVKSPITPFKPSALSDRAVQATIRDYANCAELARKAGYDGVEVMGSEGYLINQFLVTRTNPRATAGVATSSADVFPVEIVGHPGGSVRFLSSTDCMLDWCPTAPFGRRSSARCCHRSRRRHHPRTGIGWLWRCRAEGAFTWVGGK